MNHFMNLVCAAAITCFSAAALAAAPSDYVNPFIGTSGTGHTFPGAASPFGNIQASPETGTHQWKYCAGYQFDDKNILGFTQVHLNGTGCTDMGDVLLQPFCGTTPSDDYACAKSDEKASPGRYSVALRDFHSRVEITCSPHAAFYRFTYGDRKAHLLVDLQYGDTSDWCCDVHHRVVKNETALSEDKRMISGSSQTLNWFEHEFSFAVLFSRPYTAVRQLPMKEGEKGPRYVLDFDLDDSSELLVKVALSTVSVTNALENLKAEIPGFSNADFAKTETDVQASWNDLLSRIEIRGTDEQKVNFYTSLYHLFLQPYNMADVNGEYRGADGKVAHSKTGVYYTSLSLWDTFRAAHPLYTILTPERVPGFIDTMMAHYRAVGIVPIITYGGKETGCMIGNHSVPVMVDAYLKGLVTEGAEEAFAAIDESLRHDHKVNPKDNWDVLDQYGYYPFDLIREESVSRTLECAFDDWCAGTFARHLGKKDAADFYFKRARNYRNVFDPATGFMRGKDSKGNWREPFDPMFLRFPDRPYDFTEGNSWQYTWHVFQAPDDLIDLIGGKEKTAQKLDAFFSLPIDPQRSGNISDVTGLIGEYAQGNEPDHHAIFFYDFVGQPWKAQAHIREVLDAFYLAKPDGLCGNDDCGQMSAWYVFAALGFYPFNPCGGEYVLGAPQVPEAVVRLPGGKRFTVTASGLSKANKYVQSVKLNGQPLEGFKLSHASVVSGGTLSFEMGPEPKK